MANINPPSRLQPGLTREFEDWLLRLAAAATARTLGINDHSALDGLALGDDHPQYLNNTRGDARYSLLGHNHTGVYSPVGHTHTKSDITDFAHTHVKADITDFAHTHVKADITDFAHTHTSADVTDFNEAVDDRVNALLVAGTNITLNYNDAANTLTISSTGGGGDSGTTTNAVTFNDSGSGDSSGTTFDGSVARTISYNTIGAQPLAANLTSWASVTRASGFGTFVATPSSANLRALLSDEVGTGAAYFVGGALGTPASGTLTNCTGLPQSGVTNITIVS